MLLRQMGCSMSWLCTGAYKLPSPFGHGPQSFGTRPVRLPFRIFAGIWLLLGEMPDACWLAGRTSSVGSLLQPASAEHLPGW
jgi:hypothetical protein